MAVHPKPETDPIDQEIESVLADNPGLLERLQEHDRKRKAGELDLVPHDEAMRRLGFDDPE